MLKWAFAVFASLYALGYLLDRAMDAIAKTFCALTFQGRSDACIERAKKRIESLLGNIDALIGGLTLGYLSVKGIQWTRRGRRERPSPVEPDDRRAPADDRGARPRPDADFERPRPWDWMRR